KGIEPRLAEPGPLAADLEPLSLQVENRRRRRVGEHPIAEYAGAGRRPHDQRGGRPAPRDLPARDRETCKPGADRAEPSPRADLEMQRPGIACFAQGKQDAPRRAARRSRPLYFFTLLASILIDVSSILVVNAVCTSNGFSMPR